MNLVTMKHIFLIAISFILFACSKPQQGTTISGTFDKPITDRWVKIEAVRNNALNVIDSFKLDESGTFSRKIEIDEPSFYRLNFYDRNIVNMVLFDEDVELIETGDSKEPYRIQGSKDTDLIYLLSDLKKGFEAKIQGLNEEYIQARSENNLERISSLQDDFMALKKQNDEQIKSEIWQMDKSISGILALSYLDKQAEFAFLDSLAIKYSRELPNSIYTKELQNEVDNLRALAIGSMAPEISLPDPDGNIVSLSSFKGKYVLIDFWAGWCGPCRKENPNVVRMYQEYHDKGFEILGVSLDRTRDAWVNAIKKDGLIWNHVSDLKYFNSEASRTYQINSIPATYLIGPDGTIIAKNLRGPSLEAKLREIFG